MNKKFFDTIRPVIGPFQEGTPPRIEFLIQELHKYGIELPHAAYILATVKLETAHTYLPLREYGRGRGRSYGNPDPITGKTYYGRGYVQLTWKYNYERASKELGVDFVNDPDKVMEPLHAVRILIEGMMEGWFTGKDLEDYIDLIDESDREDFLEYWNARRVVNGTDKANLIAQYAESFEKGLRAIDYDPDKPLVGTDEETPDVVDVEMISIPKEEYEETLSLLERILTWFRSLKT